MSLFGKWVEARKYYPDVAAEMGQQGTAGIVLVVARDGRVKSVRLVEDSGSPFLNQAWVGMFRNVQVPPFAPGAKDDEVTIHATMRYILVR